MGRVGIVDKNDIRGVPLCSRHGSSIDTMYELAENLLFPAPWRPSVYLPLNNCLHGMRIHKLGRVLDLI
jgi:hypothetical protein